LKRSLRNNFLKIEGEKICELDIKNSQPLFLAKLIMKEQNGLLNEELQKFVKVCVNNKFYQSFDSNISKTEIKRIVYQVFFGKNLLDDNNLKFKKSWPILWQWIVDW